MADDALCREAEALRATLARFKEYLGVMEKDKRMRVMARILLDQLVLVEKEERERVDGRAS